MFSKNYPNKTWRSFCKAEKTAKKVRTTITIIKKTNKI